MAHLINGIQAKREGNNRSLIFQTSNRAEGKLVFDGSYFTSNIPVHVPNGTAAEPALRGAATNSGIYFGSGVLYFSTAGTARANVDGQGDLNVGTYISIGNGGTGQIIGDKKAVVEGTGAAVVLTAADSGSVFYFNGDTGATQYTLPATVAGLYFKFVWTANNNNAMTITTADTTDTSGDMFCGGLLISSAAAVNNFLESAADMNRITVDDNNANTAGGPGTWIELTCVEDAIWFVSGVVNSTSDNDSTGSHFSDVD